MPIWLERFVLVVCAAAFIGIVVLNLMKLDWTQRITLGLAVVFFSYFISHTLYKQAKPPVVQPSVTPPKPIEQILMSTEEISSPDASLPYGIAVTLQTTVPISPTHIRLRCSGSIGKARVSFAPSGSVSTSIMFNKQTIVKGNTFEFSFDQPAFTPQRPLLIKIFSAFKIEPTSIKRIY